MTLDQLLKESADWLAQARKRNLLSDTNTDTIGFPEDLRRRRIAELKTRIDQLTQNKEKAVASYDRAIALEQAELESLYRQESPGSSARTR
jgi:hypothetical protein